MTPQIAARIRTPVDQKVRDEIKTKLGVNMCVEAGAGTGKTTSLVNRIVEVLATAQADADHVGVITFTEKAAAELSSRVRERLERAIAEETNAERLDQLTDAVRALYRSRIETIHAFAANVLRERPVEAGLDPEYSILSTLEGELLFDERYTIWLDELMSDGRPEVERALNLGMTLDDFRTAAETLHRFRYLLPLEPFETVPADSRDLGNWLDTHLPELEGIRDCVIEDADKGPVEIAKLVELKQRFDIEATTDAARDRLASRSLPRPALNKGSQSSWEDPEDCRRMKDLFREYREIADRLPMALRTNSLLGVLPHIEAFVGDYEQHRRQQGVADFDDILIWARNVLRDNLDVRGYFQRRFKALLIDEFQDTDPIQVEIATYLTADGQRSKDWRKLMPTEGKLFVVGDPKQSIYRFRRADIAIYDQVKRYLLADGFREITQNFRSSAPLIEWVNRTFDELLEETEGVQPANVELKPWHKGVRMDRPPVVVVRGHHEELDAQGVRETESDAIASLLRDATSDDGKGTRWQVRDQATERARDATPGDVAILLPTRGGLEAYEDALSRATLPFRHEGSRDYFQRDEVRDFVLLLQTIDDPLDRLALVGALRSPAFGCSDDDIVIHAGTGGSWDYRSEKESESERVVAALAVLRELHWRRAKLSLPELVQEVLDRSLLVEFALTNRDEGAQAAANLLGIVDQARAFTAAGGGGPRAFTRWLVQHAERQATEVDTDIAEEGDDVVRLLTMHGSKGLEFPIVVLANLATADRSGKESVPDEEHDRLHFRIGVGSRNGYYETPDYEAHWDEEKGAQTAEQIRLLYVAATRARDHLIIPDIQGKAGPGSLLSSLQPLLPEGDGHEVKADGVWLLNADELELPEKESLKPRRVLKPELTSVGAERDDWLAGHKETLSEAREELELVVASSVERSVRPLAAEASHSAGAMLVSEGPPLEIGDALHLVMERISLPNAEDLDQVVGAICAEAGIPEHVDEVTELARRCLASATVKRALELGTYQREVPFTVPTEDGFALGRVDLAFQDGEDLRVVDFKTDEVGPGDAERHTLEHHAGQADTYETALGAATGLRIADVTFVYCRSGAEVKIGAAE